METELLRKLQHAQLSILIEFARVCEENRLTYFLDGGTLLGAVRHKGFIPWDDDVDVGMPREDYDKFATIAEKVLPDNLFWQSYFTDSNYPNAFGKIRLRNTVFDEIIYEDTNIRSGIFIDILPFDNFPDKRWQQVHQGIRVELYKHLLLMKDRVKPWKGMMGKRRLLKELEYIIFIPLSSILSHTWLVNNYDKCLKKYNGLYTKWVKEPDLRYAKVIVPSSCITDFIELEFEGHSFSCPKDYDAFLRQLYGDYMQLPPENQRGGWHGVRTIRF